MQLNERVTSSLDVAQVTITKLMQIGFVTIVTNVLLFVVLYIFSELNMKLPTSQESVAFSVIVVLSCVQIVVANVTADAVHHNCKFVVLEIVYSAQILILALMANNALAVLLVFCLVFAVVITVFYFDLRYDFNEEVVDPKLKVLCFMNHCLCIGFQIVASFAVLKETSTTAQVRILFCMNINLLCPIYRRAISFCSLYVAKLQFALELFFLAIASMMLFGMASNVTDVASEKFRACYYAFLVCLGLSTVVYFVGSLVYSHC